MDTLIELISKYLVIRKKKICIAKLLDWIKPNGR